jgi:hypothetical protein
MLPARLPCRNGAPFVGGDGLGCRCFDFVGRGRVDACPRQRAQQIILDPDRFEALL